MHQGGQKLHEYLVFVLLTSLVNGPCSCLIVWAQLLCENSTLAIQEGKNQSLNQKINQFFILNHFIIKALIQKKYDWSFHLFLYFIKLSHLKWKWFFYLHWILLFIFFLQSDLKQKKATKMVMEHFWRQVKEVWKHEGGHGASSWQLRID